MFIFKVIMVISGLLIFIECLNDCRRIARNVKQHQCELTPQSIEGPFYNDTNIIRSQIRDYRPGVPLELTLYFTDANTCKPMTGLWITIWQCDAIGYYSHYTKINPSVIYTSDEHANSTDDSTFLRAAQQTDKNGRVKFETLLPGWYANRTRHINFKAYQNNTSIFTGQLYFTEQLSDWLFGIFPYYVQKRVYNREDFIFNNFRGVQTIIYNMKPLNKKRMTDGFTGEVVVGLKTNSTVI